MSSNGSTAARGPRRIVAGNPSRAPLEYEHAGLSRRAGSGRLPLGHEHGTDDVGLDARPFRKAQPAGHLPGVKSKILVLARTAPALFLLLSLRFGGRDLKSEVNCLRARPETELAFPW
jgi:hypothetical protein